MTNANRRFVVNGDIAGKGTLGKDEIIIIIGTVGSTLYNGGKYMYTMHVGVGGEWGGDEDFGDGDDDEDGDECLYIEV